MGRGTWSWIVPDARWEIAEPLARKGIESSERLGRRRWVMERTMAGCFECFQPSAPARARRWASRRSGGHAREQWVAAWWGPRFSLP